MDRPQRSTRHHARSGDSRNWAHRSQQRQSVAGDRGTVERRHEWSRRTGEHSRAPPEGATSIAIRRTNRIPLGLRRCRSPSRRLENSFASFRRNASSNLEAIAKRQRRAAVRVDNFARAPRTTLGRATACHEQGSCHGKGARNTHPILRAASTDLRIVVPVAARARACRSIGHVISEGRLRNRPTAADSLAFFQKK